MLPRLKLAVVMSCHGVSPFYILCVTDLQYRFVGSDILSSGSDQISVYILQSNRKICNVYHKDLSLVSVRKFNRMELSNDRRYLL